MVGQIGSTPEGYLYGVEILDQGANLWDLEFPSLTGSETSAGRVLLECLCCSSREVAYLNELELEVFQGNQPLSRSCKHCQDATLWGESQHEPASRRTPLPQDPNISVTTSPPAPKRTKNERKQARLEMNVHARVKTHAWGEDVALTKEVSRGGFYFRSSKNYAAASIVEVAIPYLRGMANIFVPARIAWVAEISGSSEKLYGVSYLSSIESRPKS